MSSIAEQLAAAPRAWHCDPPRVASDDSEAMIQFHFLQSVRTVIPRARFVGIPNAGKRTRWEAQQRQREGVSPGFPDVIGFAPGRPVIALEFKSRTGALSPAQREWLDYLASCGLPCGVFRHWTTALAFVRDWYSA